MSTDWPYDPETGEILGDAPGPPNVMEFSVSELSFALKQTLEDRFGYVRVRGELGRVSRPASGHVYLDLKDEKAVLNGVIWKGVAGRLKVKPEQGLEVIVSGKITTFPGQSRYQIVIDTMEPAGAGALMALLEERKKKLGAEGLFDEERKQPIPFLPQVIGVVTSPTGAVIRDILHRLSDRFPRRVLVWPVRVQGENCAPEVAAAINGFNAIEANHAMPRPDLIIVARGGGSLEDLWGFNEEAVVRAAAASRIPLISAVGHETDWTLIDHAADWRAPTPTAAAERAVPVRADLAAQVATMGARLQRAHSRSMDERQARVTSATRALPRPDDVLALARQRFDSAAGRLHVGLRASTQSHRGRFDSLAGRLSVRPLRNQIAQYGELLARHQTAMARSIGVNLQRRREHLAGMEKLLRSLSYKDVLQRGFALTFDASGKAVTAAAQANAGDSLSILFHDGAVGAVVSGSPPKPKPKKPKAAKSTKPGNQGTLF